MSNEESSLKSLSIFLLVEQIHEMFNVVVVDGSIKGDEEELRGDIKVSWRGQTTFRAITKRKLTRVF